MNLTIRKIWNVNGTLTNVTSITVSVVRDDIQASILSTTDMTPIGTGVYSYTLTNVPSGTTFTATITVVYGGQTYVETQVLVPEVTPEEICWPHGLKRILDHMTSLLALVTLKPKSSYNVEGHSWSWNEYQTMLGTQLAAITKQYVEQQPYEFVSHGHGGE